MPRALPVLDAAHLPPAPEDVSRTRLGLAAFARPWPGEINVTDDGSGMSLARLSRAGTLGELTATLGPGSMFLWDTINAVELVLLAGHLSSHDESEVLAGANRIAIENDDGEWEIVGFAEAELLAPRTYRLTRLLRGQSGSDHAIGMASAGNRVLLLDSRVAMLPVSPSWLDATAELRSFAGASDGEGTLSEVEIGLAPMLPLMPVHLSAVAVAGGDIVFGWVRRSRADTDSWAVEDAPLDRSPEAYRLEIYNGVSLVRTIDTVAPTATYSAAQQIADFGAPPSSFSFRVAQQSAIYGPGHWAEGDFNA
jgi:hypothetical protein